MILQTMWFLFILTVMNSAFHQEGIILALRLDIGGIPLNLLDAAQGLGFLCCVVGTLGSRSRFVTIRAHPVLGATLILFSASALIGLVLGALESIRNYTLLIGLHTLLAFPVAMWAGYYFIKQPRSVERFAHIHVIGGVLSAGLITFFFFGRAAELSIGQSVESIRAVQYVSTYAGMAAALLLYMVASPSERLYPIWLLLPLLLFCLTGQFATLSRSDWYSVTAAIVALPVFLIGCARAKELFRFVAWIPGLAIALIITVVIASALLERDLGASMQRRLRSALPSQRGDDSYSRDKAWDSRLPGVMRELEMWGKSPVWGQGFGYTSASTFDMHGISTNHNVWTAALATNGIIGFAAYLIPVAGLVVVGRRLIRDAVYRGEVLMGVIGITTGVYHFVHGAATMSFNVQRGAIALGVVVGAVLRARAIQLTLAREAEYAGYLDDQDEFLGHEPQLQY